MNLVPSDETLFLIKNKTFIVSLPRTGTKSLSKMMQILGYRISHCPSIRLEKYLLNDSYDVFADTPIFCPSIFTKLTNEKSNKFIYIDRDCGSWIDSFERMKLNLSYMDYMSRDDSQMHPISILDKKSLVEIFETPTYSSELAKDKFYKHKDTVLKLIPEDQLLLYKFDMGWKNLCEFMNVPIPDQEIPHINKNTLFEKIV